MHVLGAFYDDAWTTLVGKVQSSVRRFPDFRAPGS